MLELSGQNVYSLILRSFHYFYYIVACSVLAHSDAHQNRQQILDWCYLNGDSGGTQPSPVIALLIYELGVARFPGFSYEI